ncbi:MAG: hypothetical protein HOV87_17655 [Catenulispora sp.]|nr:hypothetical protein [Catenulispora sp.]
MRAELSTGENLELYTTVLLALTLAALGMFDVVGDKVLVAATLATLALLAIGSLGSRRRVEDLTELVRAHKAGEPSATEFFAKDKPNLREQVRDARDIRILGVTLSRTIRNIVDELQHSARSGGMIKVALIDPTTDAPAQAAARSTISAPPGVFENRLRPTIDLLIELARTPGAEGRVEVRFLPFVPAFGLVLLDAQRSGGRIHVDVYSHKSAGGDAVFTLAPHRDGEWYPHFEAEFERVWEAGRPAEASDGFPASAATAT